MKCPDMKGDHISLRNSLTGKVAKGDYFYFMVDTCWNLRSYTGNTNCIEDKKTVE